MRSSVELSEATYFMWKWYKDAQRCVAYLTHVPNHASRHRFPQSQCFTRGWVLQELLAPRVVISCNAAWESIGAEHDAELFRRIADFTGIPKRCLAQRQSLKAACVAKKLSLAGV